MRSLRIVFALLMIPALAQAQEEAPVADPPAATVTAPAEPEPEADEVAGWFRVDTDVLSTQFWFGATHEIGGIAIASDIYVVGSFAEFDIGPAFSFGNLALTPMVGIGFDFATQNATTLIAPQLFTIYSADKIYFESWIQVFVNSLFADDGADSIYTRDFLLYKFNDTIAAGVQAELTYEYEGAEDITSLPVGGRANVNYGKNSTLGLFLGYETEATDGTDGIAGRFTFIRTW